MNVEEKPARLTYTLEETALILGVSRASAYNAAKVGQIKTIGIGRRLLVPRVWLDNFVNGAGGKE